MDNNVYFAGIDVGSLTTKAVVIDKRKTVVASEITRSAHDSKETSLNVLNKCLEKTGLKFDQVSYIVGTGYGRVNIPFANKSVTEISCQAKGVSHLFPSARTIVDVGGQDSKAIAIGHGGSVAQFVLNDKCAAGTGRFFEVMASALDVPLNDMGEMAVKATERSPISNTCTIFAESEIIGLMVHGTPKDWIIAGLCKSIAIRLYGMMVRIRMADDYVMTGGVARNRGVVKMLGEIAGKEFLVPQDCQLTGALGGALMALDFVEQS